MRGEDIRIREEVERENECDDGRSENLKAGKEKGGKWRERKKERREEEYEKE